MYDMFEEKLLSKYNVNEQDRIMLTLYISFYTLIHSISLNMSFSGQLVLTWVIIFKINNFYVYLTVNNEISKSFFILLLTKQTLFGCKYMTCLYVCFHYIIK